MELRRIGRSDLRIAPLVLGGNVFGWTADRTASFAILDAFFDAGFNAIDSADVYSSWIPGLSGGESERMIGEWLKARGQRERVVLATKIGAVPRSHEAGGEGRGWIGDLSAAYLVGAVERSLERLQTDYIDLCQSHLSDARTPLDETLEAYQRLIAAGKVRVIGASNHDAAVLWEALKVSEDRGLPRYESVQPLYNLCDRTAFESGLRDVCVAHDVSVLCYGSLARGFLSGAYRRKSDAADSPWRERVEKQMNPRGDRILAAVESVAGELEATCAAVALAWLIAQPAVTGAIAAVNDTAQLGEMLGGARIVLSPSQIAQLDAASAA